MKTDITDKKNLSCGKSCAVDVMLFDFGGVLAEEGFRNGLYAIGRQNGLEPESFVKTGFELVHQMGYVLGRAGEKDYWLALRRETGVKGENQELREVILSNFILRPWMLELVKRLKRAQIRVGILSDQTNWLDELEERYNFYKWFDHVFNSYYLGKSKRDSTLFDDILGMMNVAAYQVLFVDDYHGNIERAKKQGLHALLYQERETFLRELARYCPFLRA